MPPNLHVTRVVLYWPLTFDLNKTGGSNPTVQRISFHLVFDSSSNVWNCWNDLNDWNHSEFRPSAYTHRPRLVASPV